MALTDVFLKNALVNPFLCNSDRVILKDRYTLCKIGLMCVCNGMTSGMLSNRNRNRIVIVIVISKFLKRYSKAKRTRAPAYSRALRRIKGGFPKSGSREAHVRFPEYQEGTE